MCATQSGSQLARQVREHYAKCATAAAAGSQGGCSPASEVAPYDELARGLYGIDEVGGLPAEAVLASLGCGDPTVLADLQPGDEVLDLGSGGGIDVLLSAKRVAPKGKAYGLDMTDEMLDLARSNQRKAGVTNAEFLRGEIEDVPLPDGSVDVIISNCVINLSGDKDRVLAEAFRVLRPGGRLAVSDMVFQGDLSLVPGTVRDAVEAWAACMAGALEEEDYLAKLRRAGFEDVTIQVTTTYDDKPGACGSVRLPEGVRLVGAFIRATKPDA